MDLRTLPSSRWKSSEGWNYNGMGARINTLLSKVNKSALHQHAEQIMGQKLILSEPFSAGQYWLCLEMVALNGDIIIARLRLPQHPDSLPGLRVEEETYSIVCEVATMRLVREKVPALKVPQVFAYEGPGSSLASDVGATYMLIEGFYGNTLQDAVGDICQLPTADLDYVMSQWTRMQAELASVTCPQIGSVCALTPLGEPVLGKLSIAAAEGLSCEGPFTTASDFLLALAEGRLRKATKHGRKPTGFTAAGYAVFIDIIRGTRLFMDLPESVYHLNHMDLGPHNILVDETLQFVALIDWEFAQTAPWLVNHYPMPFPLLWPEEKIETVLQDPEHVAYPAISRQARARILYTQKFKDAERQLREANRPLSGSFSEVLGSPASRIYAYFTRLGMSPELDNDYVREMLRLGFGLDHQGTDDYLSRLRDSMSNDEIQRG